ncbi:MAG: glycosyltransferase [Micropruina sp.]|nr:MAG: glycosyltransferase [Micropruina sp.]
MLRHWPPGVPVPEVVELDGPWPEGDDAVRRALADALTRFDLVILDGLVAAARPELIETAQGRVVLLVHLPLADAGGLDEVVAARLRTTRAGASAAWRVIATSATAAADIVRRHGRPDVHVVRPGVESAPLSSGPDLGPSSSGPDPGPSSGGGDRVSSSTRLDPEPSSGGPDPEPSSGGPDPEPSSGGPDRVSSSGGGDRAPLSKRSNRMPSSSQVGPVSSNSGLNPAAPSPPSGQEPVPHLISVGTLGDRKNQLAFAHALQACADLPWTASVIGPEVALD